MSKIIRDLEEMDIPEIKNIINEVWGFSELINDKKVLDATIGLYINQVLYYSTFGRVATLNDKVVGVISGIVNGEKPKYRHFLEDGTTHAITLLGATGREQRGIYEYFTKEKEVYSQLSAGLHDDYNGCLDFLILSEEAQGLGIGKKLWTNLKAYFEEKNVKSVYLYSDTACNFGFYEHQGFVRKREQNMDLNFEGEIYQEMNFLYDIQFD